jgi:hypothetical protein
METSTLAGIKEMNLMKSKQFRDLMPQEESGNKKDFPCHNAPTCFKNIGFQTPLSMLRAPLWRRFPPTRRWPGSLP